MAAEDFFARWSKQKSDAAVRDESVTIDAGRAAAAPEQAPTIESVKEPAALPTQEDVAKLTHDSDYSVFMSQGVDESVRRSAMKKLFSDPHFNVMDGLDVYIEDFSKFEPISPAMLASLNHAKNLLDPLSQLQAPVMRMLGLQEENESEQKKENAPILADERESGDAVMEDIVSDSEGEIGNEIQPEQKTRTTGEPAITPSVNGD